MEVSRQLWTLASLLWKKSPQNPLTMRMMLHRKEKYPALPGIEAQFLSHPACSPVMTLSTGHEHKT